MICLVYVSSAGPLLDEGELAKILEISRANNAAAGITGLLMFAGGNIFQAIEGDEDAVSDLFNRIERDPRHTGLRKMTVFQIEKRQFPDWSMALKRPRDLPEPYRASSISDIQRALTAPDTLDLSRPLRILVGVFAEGMR